MSISNFSFLFFVETISDRFEFELTQSKTEATCFLCQSVGPVDTIGIMIDN